MTFTLEELLKTAGGFSPSEIEDIMKKGKLVKGVLDSLSDRELAVKFAFKVENANLAAVQEAFMESNFKKLDPAVYELGKLVEGDADFADLKLEPNTDAAVKLYLAASPGDDLNLSADEIAEFHKLGKKASREDVEKVLQSQLAKRYQSYREVGLKGVAPYQRSKSKSYSAGDELQHKTEMMVFVQKHVPEFYKYCVEYPNAPKPDGLVESFSYTNTVLDDLPTFALVHKIGYPLQNGTTFGFFQRMFYVSRSHNSVQGVGGSFVCQDDPTSSIMVYATRTSTDKVAGFGGSAKRALGARIMSSKQAENFEKIQKEVAKKG